MYLYENLDDRIAYPLIFLGSFDGSSFVIGPRYYMLLFLRAYWGLVPALVSLCSFCIFSASPGTLGWMWPLRGLQPRHGLHSRHIPLALKTLG
jgi:hypothetical protein